MSGDLVVSLIDVLKADAGVAALVADRVFGLELPPDQAAQMPRKAVVLQPSGGVSLAARSYLQHDTQRIDAFGYGETPLEAERVRRAVFDALKPLRRVVSATVLIHWVEPAGGWSSGRDPAADWPVNFQSFQAFFAEPAVV